MAFLNPKVVITAEDKTGAAFSKLHSGVAKAGDAMRTALKWGAVGFGLLATEAVLAIKAFEATELASARLRSSFQGIGGITKESADELERYANSLQYSTAMADEQIVSGMAMLGTFRLTTEQVKQLTPGMLDAAAALEKTTGQAPEMEQLAIQIGKAASSGNVGMLKKWGLSLTEVQQAAFGAADQQGRVNILTQAFAENFGGMAAASANTFTGKLRIMQLAIDDLQESIGKAILEALEPWILKITEWAKSDQGKKTVEDTTNAIINFVKVTVEKMTELYNFLKSDTGLFIALFFAGIAVAALAASGSILFVVALLIALFLALKEAWDNASREIKIAWDQLKRWIGEKVEGIKNFFVGIWDKAVEIFNKIKEFIGGIWNGIVNFVSGPVNTIKRFFTEIWNVARDTWQRIADWIHEKWNSVSDIVNKVSNLNPFSFSKFFGKQFGGYAEAGQPIMVGEAGPELFVPSQSGTVKPKGSFGIQGGGGNTNIVVNIGMYAGTETEKRRIAEDLLKAVGDRARARNIGLSQYLEVI